MTKQTLNTALIFSLAISIIASFLRLLHVPGSNVLLLAALSSLAISALAKNAADLTFKGVITGLVIAWACIAVLFKLMKWPDGDLIFKSAIIIGIVWMAYIYFIDKGEKTE